MARTKLRIKDIMKEKGITQVQLANALGITPISLNQQFARNTFNLDRLEEIAKILNVRVIDLFCNSFEIKCPHCGKSMEIQLNIVQPQ